MKLLPRATASLESNVEISILQQVQKRASTSPSRSEYIRKYLRNFIEFWVVGEYLTIVFEATGQSVQSKLFSDSISLPKRSTLSEAPQVVYGTCTKSAKSLTEVSLDAKILFDLRKASFFLNLNRRLLRNIKFVAPDLIGMNDDQVLECIGPVKQAPVISLCGGPWDKRCII